MNKEEIIIKNINEFLHIWGEEQDSHKKGTCCVCDAIRMMKKIKKHITDKKEMAK